MERYFGLAKQLLEMGIAHEDSSYSEENSYDLTIDFAEDIPFYLALAQRAGGRVLDIGCGTGRIMDALLADGREVVGLDLSPQMLATARKKLESKGYRPRLIHGDMRDFRIPETFSLVIVPYCSMIYMHSDEQRRQVLRNAHQHLEEGGILAFDFDTETCQEGESRPWLSLQDLDIDKGEVIVETAQMKGLNSNLRLINIISYRYSSKTVKIAVKSELEATCSAKRMQELLVLEGFWVEGVYGDFQHTFYKGGDLCVLVACKQ